MRSRARRIIAFGAFGLSVAALSLTGCGGVIPPTYTIEEMAARCTRDGGVWRGFVGYEGYCEYQSPGFL